MLAPLLAVSEASSLDSSLQRTYALLVRLHDLYGMHEIFEPGFPGLLEAFYVQERLMEWLMPEVYESFVSCAKCPIDKDFNYEF